MSHENRAHALLSASGAKRWMACTPSARIEDTFEEQTSEFAEQGTAAHEYAELLLKTYIGGNDGGDIAEAQSFCEGNKYYDDEMEHTISKYAEDIIEKYEAILAEDPSAEIFLEQRLNFSEWVRDGFGTGDVMIISNSVLDIIDLKYGKGVKVEAYENPQLKLYGLGAIYEYAMLYDIEKVRLTIMQPRLNHISEYEIPIDELMDWANNTVKPLADMAYEGKGDLCAGDHCQFCKARNRCKALRDYAMEVARFDFIEADLMDEADIAEVLSKIDVLEKWAKSVKAYALDQAENHGVRYPGFKLVEGRSSRIYSDPDKIIKILLEDGFKEPLLYKPREILTLTAMEKLVGKKKFGELAGDLIIKPPGKPTLAPESDKRPEINSTENAKSDFAEVD